MKQITSPDNAFYKELYKLATSARQRGKQGKTLLDGPHLLAAYMAGGKQPVHLLINAAALEDAEIQALLQQLPQVPLSQLADALFAELSELKTVSGLLALIDVPQSEATLNNTHFALLLETVQDPGNLGSMLRSAAAAGCDHVFMSTGCADAWSPRVLRAAMGGHFVLNVCENADLQAVARTFDGTIFAATLQSAPSIYASAMRGNIAFAIGNEGSGLTQGLQDLCSPVTIPMPGRVESLNAAAAAAICLFEAVRQRQ